MNPADEKIHCCFILLLPCLLLTHVASVASFVAVAAAALCFLIRFASAALWCYTYLLTGWHNLLGSVISYCLPWLQYSAA